MSGQGRPELAAVDAAGLSLAIAATRWHAEITDSLVDRATAAAKACGVTGPLVVRVPGAVELPVVAQQLAQAYDAVACLGAVIRGGTPHFCQSGRMVRRHRRGTRAPVQASGCGRRPHSAQPAQAARLLFAQVPTLTTSRAQKT